MSSSSTSPLSSSTKSVVRRCVHEEFNTDEDDEMPEWARRPRVSSIQTLSVGDPVRLLTTAYLTTSLRLEGHEPVTACLLDLIFEYTAPTVLECFVKQIPTQLQEVVPERNVWKMTSDFYHALLHIFQHLATGINKHHTPYPHKTMTRENLRVYYEVIKHQGCPESIITKTLDKYGIAHWFERTELSFDGFCEIFIYGHLERQAVIRGDLSDLANYVIAETMPAIMP